MAMKLEWRNTIVMDPYICYYEYMFIHEQQYFSSVKKQENPETKASTKHEINHK